LHRCSVWSFGYETCGKPIFWGCNAKAHMLN
jgi:hypothetical protein